MLKVAAIAILGLSLVVCVGTAAAVEMAVTTGDFAHSGSGGGSGEGQTATRNVGAMREAANRDVDSITNAHERVQPDSASVTRTDGTHAALGTDADSTPAGTPVKKRHDAHWQSLLPGVMK